MADLHRAGRYDQMSDDVLMLMGQGSLSVQVVVRKNVTTCTTSAKAAFASVAARLQQTGVRMK